ncbi:IS630 family transposase [Aetokthonos hydrillicola Thurmond2011]|uniref:IS630 family transposase n=1 Tax=Aetokthonos hydrillicola Thurmond2011 TaxID=2712845 RepID=A0AAP5MAA6_9CYAN|nr:IS630 family transposase [Aetokthonos hydrillicola]MDR9900966.1 IS630 family transposase [Aetokthonos hydrillicola Thurmond2011]
MPRRASPLHCSDQVRQELMAISRSRKEEARFVERARIVLACLDGKEIQQVAKETGASIPTVSKWRARFAKSGIAGLRDRPRSGKPATYGPAFRDRVLSLLEQPPPPHLGLWDGREVARVLGASVHAVWRLLRREGIYLQRHRTWCVSTDPEFAPKAAEVVGLYLNPPLNALVLSVDEKPGIQAIQRPSGYVETDSGAVVRAMKSTYKRHGTLNLFAALEIATGQIHAQTSEQKKREDFRRFLDAVLSELPGDREIHVILDNYCTHKRNQDWLAKWEGRVHFHFTPTSASWLNQIEIWFGLLTRKALRGASFSSKEQLRAAIEAFVARTNEHPKPFHWRKREVQGSQLRNTIINLRN